MPSVQRACMWCPYWSFHEPATDKTTTKVFRGAGRFQNRSIDAPTHQTVAGCGNTTVRNTKYR